MVKSETEEVTERAVDLNLVTLVGIVEGRATGLENVEEQNNTEARLRNLELSEDRSASSLTDETE